MKNIIYNQRNERDELMARPYQQRQTKHDVAELLASPLIKLITGPRRVGKSVFALLMLRGKNFASSSPTIGRGKSSGKGKQSVQFP